MLLRMVLYVKTIFRFIPTRMPTMRNSRMNQTNQFRWQSVDVVSQYGTMQANSSSWQRTTK